MYLYKTCSSSSNNNIVQSCQIGGSLQRTQTLPTYLGREDDGNEFQDQETNDSRMGFLIHETIASSSSGFSPMKQNTLKVGCLTRRRWLGSWNRREWLMILMMDLEVG